MIASRNLHFSYNSTKNFSFPDLHCDRNETLLILGQSGQGKTTLLHLLALLLKPASGTITIGEVPVTEMSSSQRTETRARKIGLIYQRAHFVNALNVLDNILMPNYLAGQKQNIEKATYLAEQLGLTSHLSKKPNRLSQGEQQRVSIARALMNNPDVLLADEPTSSLDDINCRKVVDLLTEQSTSIGASLVIVTHDQRLKDEFPNKVFL